MKQSSKGKANLTLATLLKQQARYQADDRMPLEVRDWLSRFIAGTPLPPISFCANNPEAYREVAWVVAVLDDHYTTTGNEGLPTAAIAVVQNYLRELEEETDLRIWNEGSIARSALPLMIAATKETDASDALAVVKAAFAMHCARKEVSDFLTRSGLRDSRYADPEWEKEQLAEQRDYDASTDAALILSDSETSVEDLNELTAAITDFSNSTNVFTHHPALVESALYIMFESMSKRLKGKNQKFLNQTRQEEYDRLHAIIKKLKAKKGAKAETE